MLNSNSKVTGSIKWPRLVVIGTTAHSTPQWPTEPGSLYDRLRVSFLIIGKRKEIVSDHIWHMIFAQSTW